MITATGLFLMVLCYVHGRLFASPWSDTWVDKTAQWSGIVGFVLFCAGVLTKMWQVMP